jgi:4-hydroxybenzoate polyprenyltransferase
MIDKMSTVALVLYFILVKGFVNTVLYDMRDVKGDEKNGIRIMPILIGRKRTVQILLAINSTLLPIIMFFNGGARLVAGMLVLNGFVRSFIF